MSAMTRPAWLFEVARNCPASAFFRVDKQGVGDSEGDCAENDFESELAGYRAAFRALKNYDFIDTNQVYILGISNGGGFGPLVPETDVGASAECGVTSS